MKKVPFKVLSHLSMTKSHCTTYISEDGRLGFCDHMAYKCGRPYGRSWRHWRIDDKVYKTTSAFLKALKDFNPTKDTK